MKATVTTKKKTDAEMQAEFERSQAAYSAGAESITAKGGSAPTSVRVSAPLLERQAAAEERRGG